MTYGRETRDTKKAVRERVKNICEDRTSSGKLLDNGIVSTISIEILALLDDSPGEGR